MVISVTPSTTYTLTTPSITSPVTGATVSGTSVTLTATPFDYTPNDGTVSQVSASWVLYSDAALQNTVQSDLDDTVNLSSYTFNNLTPGQTYYATVEYVSSSLITNDPATSAAVSFTMAAPAAVAPTVSFDGRFSTLPLLITITGTEHVPVLKNNQNLSILTSSMGATGSETGPSLHLAGDPDIYTTGSQDYIITDYKLNQTYTAAISAGTVSISGDTVSVTAPSVTGPIVLIVNNKPYTLNVLPIPVYQPSIISPVSGAANQALSVTFTSSDFSTPVPGPTQVSASWELATDAAFTQIFSQSLDSTTNLTSWTVNGLTISTTYYARVRYTSSNGEISNWSPAIDFITKNTIIASIISSQITSPVSSNDFGQSVSMDATGYLVAISAPYENSYTGAVYIYQNISGVWTQVVRLAGGVSNSWYGFYLSLSSDGSTLCVGAYGEASYAGAIYFYKNIAGTWTQTAKFIGTAANSGLGITVALNTNGTTSCIGAYIENSNTGAAYIYQDVAGTWTQMARITSSVAASQFGISAAISADGTIVLVGASSESTQTGAAYVYQNVSGTWTQIARLASGVANSQFGTSVSLSSDGTIVLIGAYYENSGIGAAYVFQNVSGTWTQTARLAGSVAGGYYGISCYLSSDGLVSFVGASSEGSNGNGAIYVYQNQSGTWTEITHLVGTMPIGYFGNSLSSNANGTTAVIGASQGNTVYIAE